MPSLSDLSRATRLKTSVIEELVKPFLIDVEQHDWKTVTVRKGETLELDATSPQWKSSCIRIQPRDLDHLRELVGIPERVYKRRRTIQTVGQAVLPQFSGSVLASRLTHRIDRSALLEISPAATMSSITNFHQKMSVRKASENLVYGMVSTKLKATPLYTVALRDLLRRELPILLLQDIVVQSNATLNLSTTAAGIFAFRVKVHTGGRIVTPTYAKIHCHTVQSNL